MGPKSVQPRVRPNSVIEVSVRTIGPPIGPVRPPSRGFGSGCLLDQMSPFVDVGVRTASTPFLL